MQYSLTKLSSLHRVALLLRLLFVSLLFAGCTDNNLPQGAALGSKSSIGLGQAPDILSRAVDPAQLRPIVTMNGIVVSAERASDDSWFVNYILFDSSLEIEMRWVENYNGQDLTLASWSGSFANISSDSSFTVPVAQYETDAHDADSDGTSNLAERVADSDPYAAPFSATDVRGIWLGACDVATNNFDFTQLAVTFGPTSYQISVVSYANPAGCSGTNYVSVNLLGSYVVPGGVTELEDGNANHLDITYRNGTISAGDDFTELLTAQGTTLQDVYTAEGFPNINDVSLEQLEVTERLFTIYRIDQGRFFTGGSTGFRNGSTADRRHNVLFLDEGFDKL